MYTHVSGSLVLRVQLTLLLHHHVQAYHVPHRHDHVTHWLIGSSGCRMYHLPVSAAFTLSAAACSATSAAATFRHYTAIFRGPSNGWHSTDRLLITSWWYRVQSFLGGPHVASVQWHTVWCNWVEVLSECCMRKLSCPTRCSYTPSTITFQLS